MNKKTKFNANVSKKSERIASGRNDRLGRSQKKNTSEGF